MTIGESIGGAEETVNLVAIFGILAIIVYAFYKFPDALAEVKADLSTAVSGITNGLGLGTNVTGEGYDIGGYDTPSDSEAGIPASSTTGQGITTVDSNCFKCEAGLVLAGLCEVNQIGQSVCSSVAIP